MRPIYVEGGEHCKERDLSGGDSSTVKGAHGLEYLGGHHHLAQVVVTDSVTEGRSIERTQETDGTIPSEGAVPSVSCVRSSDLSDLNISPMDSVPSV